MSIALQLRLWFRAVIVLEIKVKITSQVFIVKFFFCKSNWKKKASTLKFDFVTTNQSMANRQFSLAILVQSTCICLVFLLWHSKSSQYVLVFKLFRFTLQDLSKNTLWKACLFRRETGGETTCHWRRYLLHRLALEKLCLVTPTVFHLKCSQSFYLGVRSREKNQ